MKTDMVIRGEEWLHHHPHLPLSNSPGSRATAVRPHAPAANKRPHENWSKRQNDVSAESYRHKGYLPEVIIKLRHFWLEPGTTQELFTLTELIDAFRLTVQKAGAVFDLEKLDWLGSVDAENVCRGIFRSHQTDCGGAVSGCPR